MNKCLLRTTFGTGVCVHSAHPPDFGRDWAAGRLLLQAAADRHLQVPGCTALFGIARCATLHCLGHEGRNCPADKNEPNRLEPLTMPSNTMLSRMLDAGANLTVDGALATELEA